MIDSEFKEWAGGYLFAMEGRDRYCNANAFEVVARLACNLGQAATPGSINFIALRRASHAVGEAATRDAIFQLVCECHAGEVPRSVCGVLFWRLTRR